MEPCTFTDHTLCILLGVSALLGTAAMVLFTRKHSRCSDYFVGTICHVAITFHLLCDVMFLYSPRFMIKDDQGNFVEKVGNDFKGCFITAVRQAWAPLGMVDTRLYKEEHLPAVLSIAYGFVFFSATLASLTFFAHLFNCPSKYALQFATGLSYFINAYYATMPEYLNGFKNTTNPKELFITYGIFLALPALVCLISLCKLCGCCSSTCGPCGPSVCPFSGQPAAPAEKKKKQ